MPRAFETRNIPLMSFPKFFFFCYYSSICLLQWLYSMCYWIYEPQTFSTSRHTSPVVAEWVKPGSVGSVSSAETRRSCNEYTEGKHSWGLQPEGFVLRCSAAGTAHDTSVHIRQSICALAHLKPISTLHPL